MHSIYFNGQFFPADQPVIHADNRSYRYGDGFFKTIRLTNGRAPLIDYHLRRIRQSMKLLNYITPEDLLAKIETIIAELAARNNCSDSARIRLSFSNGRGSLYEPAGKPDCLIEATPLASPEAALMPKGLLLGICPLIRKSCDAYANLKSASYLTSSVAAGFAREHNWDDALIINQHDRIAESTVSNIFWLKNETLHTPPLSEGCVAGVMRSFLMENLGQQNGVNSRIRLIETTCTENQLLEADEIFLTNALTGIRWVERFGARRYTNAVAGKIWKESVYPIWIDV